MKYWEIETQLCLIANKVGLSTDEMLEMGQELPYFIQEEVSSLLWAKVEWFNKRHLKSRTNNKHESLKVVPIKRRKR